MEELPLADACPICGNPARFGIIGDSQQAECPRCSRYRISRTASTSIGERSSTFRGRMNASSWIYEARNPVIDSSLIEQLFNLPTPTVGSKALKLLAHFAELEPTPGRVIRFAPETDLAAQAASWSEDRDEVLYLLQVYLQDTQRAVMPAIGEGGSGYIAFLISPAGWALLEESRRALGRSSDGFVAMSFATELRPTRDALLAGIRAAGWVPIIIDREEFTDKVDDEIVARIRQCRFVVADMTNQRQNVYFEAGYAEGLGKPIVWSCRQDQLEGLHFDVRQYNFIGWRPDALNELSERVKNRIGHVLGWGPQLGTH
jgi:nucleoside 2-deoxyribosyltransferase